MSTLSDVQALYGSVRDSWANSQTHVVTHLVMAVVIFGLCGASLPEVAAVHVDPKRIADSEWYKLAKDSAVLYAAFVIPIVVLAVYAAVLRVGGQFCVAILMLAFPPSAGSNPYRLVNAWTLEPLALTLGRGEFALSDLQLKSSEYMMKYQSQRDGPWQSFQQSLGKLGKNSQDYLGDFLLFLVIWVALFQFPSPLQWAQENRQYFWPVALVLLALAAFTWFRVSRIIAMMPGLHLNFVCGMVRVDPDMKPMLEVSDEVRESIRSKLEELLRREQERVDSRPSLWAYVRHRSGLERRAGSGRAPQGRPFPRLYEEGGNFASDKARHARYDEDWIAGYLAYLYFRTHQRLKFLWQMVRYIVTGAP